MTDNVYLSADRTRIVDENAPGKKWQVSRAEAVKLGLLDSEEKPKQTRRVSTDKTNGTPQRRRSASKQGQGRGLNEDA